MSEYGDVEAIAARQRRAAIEQERVASAFRDALDTAAGRALVWWILEGCHVFQTSFVPGSADRTVFAEGERSIGLRLIDAIERYCPMRYRQMQEEALERSRSYTEE